MKALFIPLRTRWFRDFELGVKTTEYRAYGPRWNEKTCHVGRRAVLSYGYGRARRMNRTVTRFDKLPRTQAPKIACEIFPNAAFIAAIEMKAL